MGTGTLVRAAPHKVPVPMCFTPNKYFEGIRFIIRDSPRKFYDERDHLLKNWSRHFFSRNPQ